MTAYKLKTYYSLIIPPASEGRTPTKWHSQRGETLSRGAFSSGKEAREWAKKNIPGHPFTVRKFKGVGAKSNPSKKIDNVAAAELWLYADNDGQLYRQQREPIEKNLARKWKKGTYDFKKSIKLWGYLMESAAKKYHKEFGAGGKWYEMFNKPTRDEAAKLAAEAWRDAATAGAFDNPASKSGTNRKRRAKYAKGAGVRKLMAAVSNPGGGKMSKKEFEQMFKDMVLPDIEMEEFSGPDAYEREDRWKSHVEFYVDDGMLPSSALKWKAPKWLIPADAVANPKKRKKAATKKKKASVKKKKGAAKRKKGALKRRK